MKIAIIGSGKIGSALAKGLAGKNHNIILGQRDITKESELTTQYKNIRAAAISQAVSESDVIIIAVPLASVPDVAKSLGDVTGKIIIETTNAFGKPFPHYMNGTDALKTITGNEDVVKCFSTVGVESFENAQYGNTAADMFVAGNSADAKAIAVQLSADMGFGNCYDLGGDDALPMMENIALLWGSLVFKTGLGRNIAFKILTR